MLHYSPNSLGLTKFLISQSVSHNSVILSMTLPANADASRSLEMKIKASFDGDDVVAKDIAKVSVKRNILGPRLEEMKEQWKNWIKIIDEKWKVYFDNEMNPIHDEGIRDESADLNLADLKERMSWMLSMYQTNSGNMTTEKEEHLQNKYWKQLPWLPSRDWELYARLWENCNHENRSIFMEFDFV